MQIYELLESLSKRRSVFHSEADFQHALAWEIQLSNHTASIRLEQQVASQGPRIHLDLLVKDHAHHVALELKYKTKKASMTIGEEDFHLRNQSAQDIGRYDFVKDIERIERYVDAHPVSEGYVVFLTNDPTYWQASKKVHAVDSAFRMHEGRIITGELAWAATTSIGTMHNRESSIKIMASYELTWHNFSHIDQQIFRYVVVHVQSTVG